MINIGEDTANEVENDLKFSGDGLAILDNKRGEYLKECFRSPLVKGLKTIAKEQPLSFSDGFTANTHEEQVTYTADRSKINVFIKGVFRDCQEREERQCSRS